MQRPCDVCGTPYEAKRPSSKFCSGTCRKRAQRGASTETPRTPAPMPLAAPFGAQSDELGPVEAALVRQLTDVERHQSVLGQAALALARRVDIGRDTGAGLAALVKQLEATVSAAVADVRGQQTPLDAARDELASRRAQRSA